MKTKILVRLFIVLAMAGSVETLYAQNQVGSIVKLDTRTDDPSRIPLILIHGIHGTDDAKPASQDNNYWAAFRTKFIGEPNDSLLKAKYSLYAFQYYSDRFPIRTIADELGKEIERLFATRRPMLVAHSMGGLVAKNYMDYYQNASGEMAGDFVIGLVTLATPHHGSPGGNDTDTFNKYYVAEYEAALRSSTWFYWRVLHKSNPTEPNRADLRWDNFDFKLDSTNRDINRDLQVSNANFKKYKDKVILYAGILRPQKPVSLLGKSAVKVDEENRGEHKQAELADGLLYYGYNGAFGNTDGLVPFKSALFCDSNTALFSSSSAIPSNFVCSSSFRIRRFEYDDPIKVVVSKDHLPDPLTLSIATSPRGFDHKDMYESDVVWTYLRGDLLRSFEAPIISTPPPTVAVSLPEIPTLFLFDVSGSMLENNKIEQARTSSLTALSTLKDNQQRGYGGTSVSVWAFSGDQCTPQMARQVLPFTPDFGVAEKALRYQIPVPNGGTPLPQAVARTIDQMGAYLQSRPGLSEGRIILLSDGQSTCDQIRPADVYSQARTISVKKTLFFTIGFDVPVGSPAERDLQYLASVSGGQYFPAQNQAQLARAFQKAIRVYMPKSTAVATPAFSNGVRQIVARDFADAFRSWTIYVGSNPSDPFGFFNLAVSAEALGRYKTALDSYRTYLRLAPEAPDRAEIEAKIPGLEQEYRDQFAYTINVLRSDLAYLKDYYQRLFNRQNNELAQEFRGFVTEKRVFYANLLETMEIQTNFFKRDTDDLADSMNILNNRVGLESFDRDAVSLLTIPIGQLEDLIEKIERYQSQNFK